MTIPLYWGKPVKYCDFKIGEPGIDTWRFIIEGLGLNEIKAVLDEGMVSGEGAFLVRVDGVKNDKKTKIDSYAAAPGLTESFEKAQITHKSYLTGQSAFMFTKMFVNGVIETRGVFPSEVLGETERRYFFN